MHSGSAAVQRYLRLMCKVNGEGQILTPINSVPRKLLSGNLARVIIRGHLPCAKLGYSTFSRERRNITLM